MVNLQDGSHRLAIVQFIISNLKLLNQLREILPDRAGKPRHYQNSGELIISPHQNVIVLPLIATLAAYYKIIDAFLLETIFGSYKARFVLAHINYASNKTDSEGLWDTLRRLMTVNMWQIQVFSNPFYHEGAEIPGEKTLSIDMAQRVPLFLPDGSPVKVWKKDSRGNKLGTSPMLLTPERVLETDVDGTMIVREM